MQSGGEVKIPHLLLDVMQVASNTKNTKNYHILIEIN
jgi:hypothetical protein